MQVVSARQMRVLESDAMDEGKVKSLALMQRAGAEVVAAIFEAWPQRGTGTAVVLCGPGNNGGDGFVVAQVLWAQGWQIEVALLGEAENLSGDARVCFDNMDSSIMVRDLMAGTESAKHAVNVDLLVDALFGIGCNRGLSDALSSKVDHELSRVASFPDGMVAAVDVPSGICSDSGVDLGNAVPCDLAVTFQHMKRGHVLADASALIRENVSVRDIGLGNASFDPCEAPIIAVGTRRLLKQGAGHKFDHGHALVLSGPPGKGGAARLAARGALRIGAGLVTVGCPLRAVNEHASHLSAIMIHGLDGTAGLAELLEDKRINAVCLGPGLGLGVSSAELVLGALKSGRATVLDADALSRFERRPEVLFEALHSNCVLTPHGGEFLRLFPDLAAQMGVSDEAGHIVSKIDVTKAAAKRARCTVLYKGADTVIADELGRCVVASAFYDQAAPWLATAGSGDVLAGMICGLLARGFNAFDAAGEGAWAHQEAARQFGPGLIAEDLPEQLPEVFRTLAAP